MDLNTIVSIERPRHRHELPRLGDGSAWLAGGTYLFSEAQPRLSRLIDLSAMDWKPLEVTGKGLSIAANCKVAALDALELPADWIAAKLIGQCCRSFLASFKIWNMATVGGNICLALPAGPMTSLTSALEGTAVVWTARGGEWRIPVVDFVKGPQSNALRPGDVLRSIDIRREALTSRTAFRRATLSPLGRSGVLLIGTLARTGRFVLTVTASTRHPVQFEFPAIPHAATLRRRLDAEIPLSLYHDDAHGRPDWRRHMTREFAEEIRQELGDDR